MTSIREQILDAVKTALDATAGVSGRVYRSRTNPITRTNLPCIVITPVAEQLVDESVPRATWRLTFRITYIGRGSDPDGALDPVICSAHALLMADRTLGNKAQDIAPVQSTWSFAEGDGANCVVSADYVAQYQSNPSDMESAT